MGGYELLEHCSYPGKKVIYTKNGKYLNDQKYSCRFLFMHIPLNKPEEEVKYYMCLPREAGDELLKLFKKYRVTHIFASHVHGYFEGKWG